MFCNPVLSATLGQEPEIQLALDSAQAFPQVSRQPFKEVARASQKPLARLRGDLRHLSTRTSKAARNGEV